MVTTDPVGASLSVAGILLSFKGAVDGYYLLQELLKKDSGLNDLALDYHIQRNVLRNWGDHFKVDDPDPRNCLLHYENDNTKQTITNILGHIHKLHEDAAKLLALHGGEDILVGQTFGDLSIDSNYFRHDSAEIQALSERQDGKKKQKGRIRWVTHNKSKLAEIVSKLRDHNGDLRRLLGAQASDSFTKTLPSYVLAAIPDSETMRKLQTLDSLQNSLVAHAAKLKALQQSSSSSQGVHQFESTQVTFKAKKSSRTVGVLAGVQRVWVEWRVLDDDDAPSQVSTLVETRIRSLCAMLSAITMPDLRVPKCLGLVADDDYALENRGKRRFGFVYQAPLGVEYGMADPTTLMQIIINCKEPPLEDKFKLAATLATSLALLHSSEWLHKAFRSDNILFFQGPAELAKPKVLYPSITDPWITGFEYAREAKGESVGHRPNGKSSLDYYYHPNVVHGFTKLLDLYSLGVILLEIAWWTPLRESIPSNKTHSLQLIEETFRVAADQELSAVMGSIYSNVVKTCLNCTLISDDGDEFVSAVVNSIIAPLESCRA
ncbi:MAG: hypothetical protein Q9187_003444 [Circinaria calcarea]